MILILIYRKVADSWTLPGPVKPRKPWFPASEN
jgi:hypothetical protein